MQQKPSTKTVPGLMRSALRSSALVLSLLATTSGAMAQGCFRGINLSGAEFGDPGGIYSKDYTYPSEETVRYFVNKGFDTVRLPFLWERVQPELNGAFDQEEVGRLKSAVDLLRQYGVRVILDPHNYAQYRGKFLGVDVPESALADFWGKLAALYKDAPDVTFGLMNEPYQITAAQWLVSANAATAAIRAAGAKNLILVPGTSWTGAHSWESDGYGGANGTVMLGYVDPGNNSAFEVHQYLDDDFSGTKNNCSRGADAVAALERFTEWATKHGHRAFLGEFGVPAEPQCIKALSDMVAVMEDNRDIWVGWTYWVAGDWWPESEELNIQPTASGDRPQLKGLSPFLKDFSASSSVCPALKRR